MLSSAKPCTYPGCRNFATLRGRCTRHIKQEQQAYDHERDKQDWRKWVKSDRYVKASRIFKAEHPLCIECNKAGKVKAVEILDHIVPHEGNWEKFWDWNNWQS